MGSTGLVAKALVSPQNILLFSPSASTGCVLPRKVGPALLPFLPGAVQAIVLSKRTKAIPVSL